MFAIFVISTIYTMRLTVRLDIASMSGLAHRGDFTHLPSHYNRLVTNQPRMPRKRAAKAPTWRAAATRVFALPQAKRATDTD